MAVDVVVVVVIDGDGDVEVDATRNPCCGAGSYGWHLLRHRGRPQQERFDEFNNERPHEALAMKRPTQVYKPSPRKLPRVTPELEYLQHDDTMLVDRRGYIVFRQRRSYLSTALALETVGVREERSETPPMIRLHLECAAPLAPVPSTSTSPSPSMSTTTSPTRSTSTDVDP